MEINAHNIKLTGKANIPKELEMGCSYKVLLDGEITSITEKNNQNGTKDRYYKFEPILASIEAENGEVIKAKDVRSRSRQLRNTLYREWEADPTALDFDAEYDLVMRYFLLRASELRAEALNYYKNKK